MIKHLINIQKIDSSNLNDLQIIGRQTFYETFTLENNEEDMSKYLDEKFSHKQLRKELINLNSEFYFAKIEKQIVGYLKLNFEDAQTEKNNLNGIEIERIYVLKEYHGKKVGQVIYNKALEIANSKKAHYVWLGVWEENPRAIRFYEKNGFVEFDKHVFVLGDDKQTDIMMKLKL